MSRQKLQCDGALEFGVLGLVDHTHPSFANLLGDAVMRNGLADHCLESYNAESKPGIISGMESVPGACRFSPNFRHPICAILG